MHNEYTLKLKGQWKKGISQIFRKQDYRKGSSTHEAYLIAYCMNISRCACLNDCVRRVDRLM